MSYYILIVGYRQQLAKAVNALGIPYSIIAEKPLKIMPKGVDDIVILPFAQIKQNIEVSALKLSHTPTHIIAGTEAGVLATAILRRLYQARRTSKSLLLRCADKLIMKKYLSQYDIPMAAFVSHHTGLSAQQLIDKLGLPVVVKDRKNSGGRNVVIAHSVSQLHSLLAAQRLYEQFIAAPEGSIESFVAGGEIKFTSLTQYHTNKYANIVPAQYAAAEINAIQSLNQKVIHALNIKWGLTHLEYYRKPNGLLFGEIALRPPGGYIMELINSAYGINAWEILVKLELNMPIGNLPTKPLMVCAVVMFHPGQGVVKQIFQPNTDDFPSLSKVKIKVKVGDCIEPRIGVGEDVGYCIFSGKNPATVQQDVDKLLQSEWIQLQD